MAKKSMRFEHKLAPPGWGRYLITAAIAAGIALYYLDSGFSATRFVNRVTAASGAIITVLSFILGPISWKFFPNLDPSEYRKFFGMTGFGLLAAHALLSLSFSSPVIFNYENTIPLAAGAASFALFSLLAASSSDVVFAGLGFEKWKKIQRTGYYALGLAIVHFLFVGRGSFAGSMLGELVIALATLAILARIYFIIGGAKK